MAIKINLPLKLPSYEVNLPGMLNAINGPRLLFREAKSLYHANRSVSKEKIVNISLHLIQAPLLIAESICTIALNALKFFQSLNPVIGKLTAAAGGLGGAICAVEAAYETVELSRTLHFHHQLKLPPKRNWTDLSTLNQTEAFATVQNLFQKTIAQKEKYETHLPNREGRKILKALKKDSQLSPKRFKKNHIKIYDRLTTLRNLYENAELSRTLQTINSRYLNITPEQHKRIMAHSSLSLSKRDQLQQIGLQENKNCLAGRVQIWAAHEISEKLPQLLHTLQQIPSRHSSTRRIMRLQKAQAHARKEARDLINIAKTQAHKKMVAHAIAYTAIGLTVSGICVGAFATAPYISIALIISGAMFAFFRSLYVQGVCNTNGWRIKWSLFVPDSLKPATTKQRYAMIKSRTGRIALVMLGVCTVIGTVATRIFKK